MQAELDTSLEYPSRPNQIHTDPRHNNNTTSTPKPRIDRHQRSVHSLKCTIALTLLTTVTVKACIHGVTIIRSGKQYSHEGPRLSDGFDRRYRAYQ